MQAGQHLEEMSKISQTYCLVSNYSKDKAAFYWDKTGILELYVIDIKTKEIKQVSHGECPTQIAGEVPQLAWTRDSRNLVYAGKGNRNLFKLNFETGKVDQIVDDPESVYPIGSTPDDKYVIYIKGPNLFRVDVNTKETLLLAEHGSYIDACVVNPKTNLIAYTVGEADNPLNMDMWLTRADGTERRMVLRVKEGSRDYVNSWSDDGTLLAFTTDANGVEQVGVYNIKADEWRLFGDARYEEIHPTFTAHNRKILALRNHDARVFPVVYDLGSGSCEILEFPIGVARDPQSMLDDHCLVFRLSAPKAPSHLIASFNGGKPETIVQPHYGRIDPGLLVEPKYIRYRSFDGLEIPAILYEPSTAGKHPALIEIHRGPWWQHFLYFNIFAQAFVREGYVLLQPNIRGSEGYGKRFKEMTVHDWGGGDLEDIAYATRYLKTMPTVDRERIGIWGTRYGGYVTLLALMKKPELWGAGCAISSITHLKTLYERSDREYKMMLRMFMGDPEKQSVLWEERSPLNHAQTLRCPLLMIHSVDDRVCPVEESRQLRSKLIESGKKEEEDFEYIELGKGSYAHSDPESRLRLVKLIINFFDRKLKKKDCNDLSKR